ncbi:MAG TPA: cysteine desulfurase family protein [Thermoanaerobaculaceae bacterium]|nr:cysteine desulfurase family protein [Thermoanaerobaculaceae bacterium]HPS77550.1 cysteine desulfurase family protein [Thermoanaerobaculaceae bacterium]
MVTRPLPVYLDHNATTPLDERALEAMLPYLKELFGNPASRTHPYGWAAARAVDQARQQLAAGVGAQPDELVFTSGATESCNLAIKGVAWTLANRGRHLVTCASEHRAVLDSFARLAREGWDVTVLPVDASGRVTPAQVMAALRPDTVGVSIMLANNEVGSIQPVADIAEGCRERGVLFFCDATQAAGKIPVDVAELGTDLLAFSAHKLYGPKGIGALVVRRRKPRLRLLPLLDGGGHEQGMRSGTLNVAGIVGFARALELGLQTLDKEGRRQKTLRDRLRAGILEQLDGVLENGDAAERLPNTLNLSFAGVDGGALILGAKEIAVSSGSACSSAEPEPSHVLLAIGRSRPLASASLRFSLGRSTSDADIDVAIASVVRTVGELRARGRWRPA